MKQGDACFQDGNEVVVVVDSEQEISREFAVTQKTLALSNDWVSSSLYYRPEISML